MANRIFMLAVLGVLLVAVPTYGGLAYSVMSNGNGHLYQIDLSTGAATDLGLVGFGDAEGLAFWNGRLLAIGGTVNELWDITTPPGSLIGATGTRVGIDAGLGTNPVTGKVYNYQGSVSTSGLYEVNPNTGATTLIGTSNVFGDGVGINAAGQAFISDFIFSDALYSLNLATGAATLVGPLGLGNVIVQTGLDFDGSGVLWAITSAGQLYTLNTATGAATLSGQVNINGDPLSGFEGLAIPTAPPNQVPEPASVCLWTMLIGFGWLLVRRRR